MFKKYPFIKQDGIKDCGVASLLMIIKYYQGEIDIESLRQLSKTDKQGTTAYHLIEAARELGFDAKGIKCDLLKFNSSNLILPLIAHVTINESYNHYIVIYEINFKKKTLLIADPSEKMKKISFENFNLISNNIFIVLYPIMKLPKFKNNNAPFKFIKKLFVFVKKEFKNIILLSIIFNFLSIAISFYFKYIIDGINFNSTNFITLVFIAFALFNFSKIITDYFRNEVFIHLKQKIDYVLTMDTFKQIILLPYNYYCNRTTGEVISRINDLNAFKDMLSKLILTFFIDMPLSFIAFVILYLINSNLFFIIFIMFILYLFVIIVFRPMIENKIKKIQIYKGDNTSYMVESISGFETIKGLNIENKVINVFDNKYSSFLKKVLNFEKIYNFQYFLKELIGDIGTLTVIYFGALLVVKGELTLGMLLAFNTLLFYFLNPIRNIIEIDSNYKEMKNAIKRVFELFYENKETGIINSLIKGNIKIKNLNYTYNDREYKLKNINLDIKKGEKVLLIGKSGSGKSTLLKIIIGYYKVERNQLLIDNIDINDYKKESLKNNITYISQKEMLFTDSLYNNLNINNSNEQEIIKLANMCEVDKFLDDNLGFKMLIEENGNNISGGEKQRVVLARSLLKKFNILLIDEGFSQMDIDLERRILKKIFKKYKEKTIIIVSHRMENMDLFDKVVKIEKGTIKEEILRSDY